MPILPLAGFWGKLKRGLFMTHTEIIEKMSAAVKNETALDESTLEYLEEVLIGADMGVETSLDLVDRVRKNALKEQTTSATRLRKILSDEIADLLFQAPKPRLLGKGRGLLTQRHEDRVAAHPAEPVGGVAVITFPTV